MRPALVMGILSIASAAALLHCAAASDEPNGAGPDAATEATVDPDAPAPTDGAHDAGLDAPADAFLAHCSPDHWCRTPIGEDVSFVAVWSFGPTDVIALASTSMYHWDGTSWTPVDTDAGTSDLTDLWASGPNDIWAVAQGQRRLVHGKRTAPGGAFTWSSTERDGGATRDSITGVGDDFFMSGILDDGTALLEHGVTTDGGPPVLNNIPITVTPFSTNAMYASAKDELWISGNLDVDGVILHAKKSGAKWTFTTSFTTATLPFHDYFYSMWGDGPNDIWAPGSLDANLHHTILGDGGPGWEPQPNHSTTAIANIWGSGPNDVYTVGYFGGIRHWDGTKWSVSQIAVNGNPIYHHLFGVHGSSADDVWAVGDGVALHRTPTGGP